MTRTLIIGASRGIGLELARQLAGVGERVIATSRRPSAELSAIDGVDARDGVDVTQPETIRALARSVGPATIDRLWMVAGVLKGVSLDSFEADVVREQFEINALGTLSATIQLLPCLKDGSKIALLTSRMGSIADNTSGGSYGYRMSKAALNIAGRSLSIDLKPRGIAVAILHPGWVRTDMTSGNGLIDAEESARGLIARLEELSLESSGKFLHQSGEELPW